MNRPNIATFDIEAHDWIYPICLSFYDGKHYELFYSDNCISDFLDFLFANEQYQKYRIYAHYGGRYDFLFLLDDFYKRDILEDSNLILIDGNIAKLSYNKYNFIDSKHLLLNSLAKLTEVFKTSHKKLHDIDRDNILKYSRATIEKYVKNDTIGLYEVMTQFYTKIYDNFNIYPGLTIASTSMQSFQNQNKYNIYPINSDKIDSFIRNCYYGGRVEIYKMYGDGLYYYDFNSLYPSVMVNNKYPTGNYIEIGDEDFYQYLKPNSKFLGFGKFQITTPKDLDIPFLPCKFDKLIFPLGEFIGYYSFTEINKAIKLGYEVELLKQNNNKEDNYGDFLAYICRWNNKLFNNHILHLYKQKLEAKENGDSASYLIYKIKANSLYGKTGETKIRQKYLFKITQKLLEKDFEENDGDSKITEYSENPPIFIYEERINRNYHNVGIAVEVTVNARIKLYESIELIQSKGYHIWYVDTDSIITNCPPHELKISDTKLGVLKLEDYKDSKGNTHKLENFEGLFIAPKFYSIKLKNDITLFKHKGFKKINFTFKQLRELHYKNELYKIKTTSTSINKMKESLKRINTLDRRSRFLSTKEVPKSIKTFYDKRIVKGNQTKPLRIKALSNYDYDFL